MQQKIRKNVQRIFWKDLENSSKDFPVVLYQEKDKSVKALFWIE